MRKPGHQEQVEEVEAHQEEEEIHWTKGTKEMEDEEEVLEEEEEMEEAQTTLREMSLSQKLRLTPTR